MKVYRLRWKEVDEGLKSNRVKIIHTHTHTHTHTHIYIYIYIYITNSSVPEACRTKKSIFLRILAGLNSEVSEVSL